MFLLVKAQNNPVGADFHRKKPGLEKYVNFSRLSKFSDVKVLR